MRCVCQQRLVAQQQRLYALCRRVEALCQNGHFVGPRIGKAPRKVALTPLADPQFQSLQALGQSTDDRVTSQRHGQPHQPQHPGEIDGETQGPRRWPSWHAATRARKLDEQRTAIGHRHLELGPLSRHANGPRRRLPDHLASCIAQHDFAARTLRAFMINLHARQPPGEHGHDRNRTHHGQPDAYVQALVNRGRHCARNPLSPAGVQKHNPRRAPSGCVWGFSDQPRWRAGCGPCAHRSNGQRHRVHGPAPLP